MHAYKVKAGIGVITGKIAWSTPERLESTTKTALYKYTYLFTFTFGLFIQIS